MPPAAATPGDLGFFMAATNKRMDAIMDRLAEVAAQHAGSSTSAPPPLPSSPPRAETLQSAASIHNVAAPATMSLQQSIIQGAMAGVNAHEMPGAHLMTLGKTIDGEIRKKIWSGCYFDLGSLAKVVPLKQVKVEFQHESPSFTLTPQKTALPQSFSAWEDLFLMYMAIRL